MRSLKLAIAAPVIAGVSALFLFAMPAKAGGCDAEPCSEKPRGPVVYKTFKRRDVVEPGVYGVTRRPSVYGWRERWVVVNRCGETECRAERVLLRPYKNVAHYQPPYLHRWRERVAIYKEDYGHERHFFSDLHDHVEHSLDDVADLNFIPDF